MEQLDLNGSSIPVKDSDYLGLKSQFDLIIVLSILLGYELDITRTWESHNRIGFDVDFSRDEDEYSHISLRLISDLDCKFLDLISLRGSESRFPYKFKPGSQPLEEKIEILSTLIDML